ncbi:DNA methyltransferase, partial [Pseudomonas syringae pv. tagetis]
MLVGDCIDMMRTLPDESVDTSVTSPPYYGLLDYGVEGRIGLEETPAELIARLVDVFREVRRVLRAGGSIWVNMGDSYASVAG